MSYCRFSSDNYRSDLYAYADCMGGFTTHVASTRYVGDVPELPDILTTDAGTYCLAHAVQMQRLKTAERAPIGLPHDGERFNDPDLPSFLARVRSLARLGYHVPEHVVPMIEAEIEQAAA